MAAESGKRTSIFYIVDDFAGCAWYRCHVPGLELKRRGFDVVLHDSITPQEVEDSDVIVFQRQWRPGAIQAHEYAKSLGKFTVFEVDDDLWNVHPTNPSYRAWSKPEIIGGAEALIRGADLVTTTTQPLALQLRRLNRNVRILPNMLPPEHWQVRRERPAGYDKVVLGWAGSASRGRDLETVREVVLQILGAYPQALMLVAGSESNMVFPPHERIQMVPPVKIAQYAGSLALFDIGLAPVVDSRFNQAKSDLKFVEYGMLGIPCVASNVESYVHSIVNGENGFLAKNDKGWLKYLRRLIESAELREEIGGRAKVFAEGRTIDRNISLWERAYGLAEPMVQV
jgi:glycosyltransferase involved in cell wall biosynthesis